MTTTKFSNSILADQTTHEAFDAIRNAVMDNESLIHSFC